jgi:tRNA (guanine37-N1)-methyltransferase
LDVRTHDLRRFAKGVHQSVDDNKPFGGGPGMVLEPEPVFECLESVLGDERPLPKMLLMTPDGAPFTQKMARALVREPRIVILCCRPI